MLYLIDAYNLLFRALKKQKSLERARIKLIEEINEATSLAKLSVVLVFDGAEENLPYPTRGHVDAIEVIYTSKNNTADSYITEEVALSVIPTQITVVTNDRELAGRCRNYRAKILSIDEFLSFLSKKKSKKKKLLTTPRNSFVDSDPQIARLLKIFEEKLRAELP